MVNFVELWWLFSWTHIMYSGEASLHIYCGCKLVLLDAMEGCISLPQWKDAQQDYHHQRFGGIEAGLFFPMYELWWTASQFSFCRSILMRANLAKNTPQRRASELSWGHQLLHATKKHTIETHWVDFAFEYHFQWQESRATSKNDRIDRGAAGARAWNVHKSWGQ